MPAPSPRDDSPADPTGAQPSAAIGSLDARYPWAVFILPFAVFIVVGSLEPTPEKPFSLMGWQITYDSYPLIYCVKIALVMAAMALVWPGYRQFPLRVSLLAPAVGAVGVVVWIGLCKLGLERLVLAPLGLGWLVDAGQRSAFNPLEYWSDSPLAAYGFLAVRLWGLAAIVPVIEEFFLRGFVMRYVIHPDWWQVPFGTLSRAAILAGTLVPVLMHPAEMLAAAVWISLVTWLMWRTRNIWDCVVAHAVTNALLGAWVIATGEWYFL